MASDGYISDEVPTTEATTTTPEATVAATEATTTTPALVVPEGYLCPITGDVMGTPVIFTSGNIYEDAAIRRWLEVNDADPVSHTRLQNKSMILVNDKRSDIMEWQQRNGLPSSASIQITQFPEASTATATPSRRSTGGRSSGADLEDFGIVFSLKLPIRELMKRPYFHQKGCKKDALPMIAQHWRASFPGASASSRA